MENSTAHAHKPKEGGVYGISADADMNGILHTFLRECWRKVVLHLFKMFYDSLIALTSNSDLIYYMLCKDYILLQY